MPEILIVDDDDVIRETLRELLSTNYVCDTAETAEQALARLQAKRFDVVLTDISMPGLTGLDLLVKVQTLYPKMPVIIISGLGDQDQAHRLLDLGAFDYLQKPFRLEVVEKTVQRALMD